MEGDAKWCRELCHAGVTGTPAGAPGGTSRNSGIQNTFRIQVGSKTPGGWPGRPRSWPADTGSLCHPRSACVASSPGPLSPDGAPGAPSASRSTAPRDGPGLSWADTTLRA